MNTGNECVDCGSDSMYLINIHTYLVMMLISFIADSLVPFHTFWVAYLNSRLSMEIRQQ